MTHYYGFAAATEKYLKHRKLRKKAELREKRKAKLRLIKVCLKDMVKAIKKELNTIIYILKTK